MGRRKARSYRDSSPSDSDSSASSDTSFESAKVLGDEDDAEALHLKRKASRSGQIPPHRCRHCDYIPTLRPYRGEPVHVLKSRAEIKHAARKGCNWALLLYPQIRYFDLERKAVRSLIDKGFRPRIDVEEGVRVDVGNGGSPVITDKRNNEKALSSAFERSSEREEFLSFSYKDSDFWGCFELWSAEYWPEDFGGSINPELVRLKFQLRQYEPLEMRVSMCLCGPSEIYALRHSARSSSVDSSPSATHDSLANRTNGRSGGDSDSRKFVDKVPMLSVWSCFKVFHVVGRAGKIVASRGKWCIINTV